jgi:hypothetical protein
MKLLHRYNHEAKQVAAPDDEQSEYLADKLQTECLWSSMG